MILGVKSPAKAPGTSNQRAGSVAELQATSSPQNSPNTDPLHRGSFTNLPGAPQTIKNLFFPSKKKKKTWFSYVKNCIFFMVLRATGLRFRRNPPTFGPWDSSLVFFDPSRTGTAKVRSIGSPTSKYGGCLIYPEYHQCLAEYV